MKNYSKYINPYMEKILSGEIESCKEQKQMILNNVIPILDRDDIYIDDKKIEKGLELQKYFPFDLIEWEVFLFALIAGLFFKTGNIFFTEIRIMVGRGAGKNGFISFLCFYFLSPIHGIKHYDIDILANSEDQAKTSFNDVYEIIKHPPKQYEKAIRSNFKATKEIITGRATLSTLKFNTSSKKGKDSKRSGCIILDEKHEYTDQSNVNTLKSGLGKVWNGRVIGITTDGHIRGGLLDKEKEQNEHILEKYDANNRTLVFTCKIENKDEWDKPDKWIKANPSINDFPSLKDTLMKEVMDMPYNMDYFPEYMAKRMNFPIGNKDIEVASWEDILRTNQDLPDLTGMKCVAGIDYAKTNDFVSAVLLFRQGKKCITLQHTFVCRNSRDLKGIVAPLDEWENKGMLEYVNDVEISPDIVVGWIEEQGRRYSIQKIAIDNFRFSLFNSSLKKIGFDAYEKKNVKLVRPSDIMKISPVINSYFVNGNFIWGDCPIMRWFTNNTKKITHTNGNIEYGKIEPNYRKTDGFMALVAGMTVFDQLEEEKKAGFHYIPTISI